MGSRNEPLCCTYMTRGSERVNLILTQFLTKFFIHATFNIIK